MGSDLGLRLPAHAPFPYEYYDPGQTGLLFMSGVKLLAPTEAVNSEFLESCVGLALVETFF